MPLAGIGKVSGEVFTTPLDGGVVTTEPTLMCCHCGAHWIPRKGSGKKRGICLNCHGYTCGRPECDACVHVEQLLENIEKGRPLNFKPIVVSVPGFTPSAGGVLVPTE